MADKNRHIIVLDPGHGGHDPGAIGPTGLREADVNLAAALRARDALGDGFKVIMTRDKDDNLTLTRRCQIANDAGADLFVSIHCNAAENREAKGLEVYNYRGSKKGRELALALYKHLDPVTGIKNRGVKEAGFFVLKRTKMTAALIEVGFISNPEEEGKLRDNEYIERVAAAVAEGIREYLMKD